MEPTIKDNSSLNDAIMQYLLRSATGAKRNDFMPSPDNVDSLESSLSPGLPTTSPPDYNKPWMQIPKPSQPHMDPNWQQWWEKMNGFGRPI